MDAMSNILAALGCAAAHVLLLDDLYIWYSPSFESVLEHIYVGKAVKPTFKFKVCVAT